ncbi:MAG: AmmeMemoRadiSam system protein A [Pelovirga sp.]
MLSDTAAAVLLQIAREAIAHALKGEPYTPPPREEKSLNERLGCFVTLKLDGRLRGCIGNFQTRRPLFQETAAMAVAAATQDPRFPPLSAQELSRCQLEVTVLSPLEKISSPAQIRVGEHGIYLENGLHRGVLLPQVATEQGWDTETFLRQTCIKAGLAEQMWQAPDTEIYRFSGQIMTDPPGSETPNQEAKDD